MSPNGNATRQLLLPSIALVILLISIGIYSAAPQPYAPTSNTISVKPTVTNPEILQNWLPATSYSYTIARIDDYLAHNQLQSSSMTLGNSVDTSNGTYDFTTRLAPSGQLLSVSVKVHNFSPTISTAVTINGTLQNPLVVQSPTISFSGLDSLINSGLTTGEVNSLQQAFSDFSPNASAIVIDPSSITHVPLDPSNANPTLSYTFSVRVDGKQYSALIHCPDLDSVELILSQGNTQAFDSGIINSQI